MVALSGCVSGVCTCNGYKEASSVEEDCGTGLNAPEKVLILTTHICKSHHYWVFFTHIFAEFIDKALMLILYTTFFLTSPLSIP